jgi:CheY-like chemotaxis protein
MMSKKALVVDNDFFFVEFLSEILDERGYEVIKAYDGKEGISKLGEEGPLDLLFVDLVMPKIDGKQLIRFTRAKFPEAHFPIIAVSGTLVERLDEINEIGADYYIAKGPMEKMADHVNGFMDKIEKQPFPAPDGQNLLEPGSLGPRQVTAELMDKVDFHQAVIESIGIGIIVVDRDARIISANPLALAIVKKSVEDVLNYPITAIFPKTEKAKLINALKAVIKSEGPRQITFYATIRSQEIRIITSPLKLEGKIAGWIVVMEDTGDG